MKAADTSASRFNAMLPGSSAKVVVSLDEVVGSTLRGTLLVRETDTIFRRPVERQPSILAELTPETTVVMGTPREIVQGAVVQLAGTVDSDHALHTSEVVILTGYVRVLQGAK